MAKSHHDVGVSFGRLKKAIGSRMCTSNTQQATPHNDDMATHVGRIFYSLQDGISYRTVVARVMRNVHTKTNELWISPRYYSSSTQRHKTYFESGFVAAGNSRDNIYYTPTIEDGTHRHNPYHVRNAIGYIEAFLREADQPRLREATRRGSLARGLSKAEVVMRNFTHNIPLDMVDADAFYDLHAVMDFIITTQAIPDVDDMRAAIRGYFALKG